MRLAATVGLLSLTLYLATLAPGLTWAHDSGDGGELAAAAYTLGVAHPPGYPAYLLIAHLFARLPVGEVATRTNLLSAVSAAGAATLLTLTLARAQTRWAPAAAAGLALAGSPLLWSQATVTEVYALNALFVALLLALVPWQEDHPYSARTASRQGLALGAVWGLSLGNHPTALFCAPLVLLALWRLRRAWAVGGIGLALGLSVYLYLPLRAAAGPPVNWGDPQTLDRFWWTVSGAPYRGFLFALPGDQWLGRLQAWSGVLTRQFSGLGLIAALLGAALLWKTDRGLLSATATTALLCSLLAIGYNTTDSHLYMMPALIVLALWLGIGLDGLLSLQFPQIKWAAKARLALAALMLVVPVASAATRYPAMDLGQQKAVQELAALLEKAPPRALLLSRQDHHTFALWYFKYALGRRPDVVTVDLDLVQFDWYAAQLTQQLGTHPPPPVDVETQEGLERWSSAFGRPACRMGLEQRQLICSAR